MMAINVKEYFANLPARTLTMLCAAAAAVVLALYGYFLMWPLWDDWDRNEQTLQKLDTDLGVKRRIASNRPTLEAEIKKLESQLNEALVRLPEEKDIPKLMTQINTLGQQAGLEFSFFRPGTPIKKGFYSELPIELRVEGGYHTLGMFLDRLSKLDRIVAVSDAKISPLPVQVQRADKVIVADLKATTYMFVEKGGPASAPAKK
jgi:type IV pilus assembly protein PilO